MATFRLFVASLFVLADQSQALQYYVDCSSQNAGVGTSSKPWNSLSQVNKPVFQPGDIISFKSGSTCVGTLSPQGSGNLSSVIQITKYSAGSSTLNPVINGNGNDSAILLSNQDYWKVSNLNVTNPASTLAARQGIHVTSTDGKTHSGITIESVNVYKVAGQTNKATYSSEFQASCGILVDVSGTGSRHDDVLVQDNTVANCGGGGIKVRVGQASNQGENIHITKNSIDSCGGDGILISYGETPLMDYNVASNLGTGTYPWTGGNFAGMWVLGCHNPTMSHNVVYGSIMSADDSEAFDCDWGNTGNCTVEYNYSHDNAGGAFLNCDGCGTSGGANQIVRYNIFQNDCRMVSNGDNSKLYFYNNVMYCPDNDFEVEVPKYTDFTNNIFVGNNQSILPTSSGIEWEWNVFQDVTRPTSNGIAGDPGFVNPGSGANTLESAGGYKLKTTSPALHNGAIIADNGGLDFYGNSVSASSKPNRGVYEGTGESSS